MEEDKKYLLHCVKMINKARPETLKLLKNEPMSNLKMIERSSMCLKDPNPLTSALVQMSLKYPITVDRERAIEHGIPSKYLQREQTEFVEDTHFHGRILAKKEAVEWWVSKSKIPNQGVIDVIDTLLSQNRKEVSEYFEIDWSKVRIQWGTPNLERRRVSTRNPSIEIDPSIRDQALMQVLMPEYTIPYSKVSEDDLNKIRKIGEACVSDHLSLGTQIRIIANQMDHRRRYLPVLSGSTEVTAPLKHALVGSNFVLTNYETPSMMEKPGVGRAIEQFIQNVHYVYVTKSISFEDVREILRSSTCYKKSIMHHLMNPDLKETNFVKWARVFIGHPISAESLSNGLYTSPNVSNIRVVKTTNLSDVRFNIYEGDETVNFKFGDMRGTFKHNGPIILDITTNYTSFGDLRSAIAEISVYCRWGMKNTTSRNYQSMKQEVRNFVFNNPHLPVQCTMADLDGLLSLKIPKGRVGMLELSPASEYTTQVMRAPIIDEAGNIRSSHTNQVIEMPKHTTSPKPISVEIQCTNRWLIDHLDFRRKLKYKIAFYLQNKLELMENVTKGIFDWENKTFIENLRPQSSEMSYTCRELILNLPRSNDNLALVAFYYCFCYSSPHKSQSIQLVYHVGNFKIDFRAKDGIFLYSEKLGGYTLFGTPLGDKTREMDYSAPLRSLLDGYHITSKLELGIPVKSVRYLEENRDDIPIAEKFITYISGTPYMVVRDPSQQYSRQQTIQRHIKAKHLWMAGTIGEYISKDETSYDSDDSVGVVAKKARVDEEGNLLPPEKDDFSEDEFASDVWDL